MLSSLLLLDMQQKYLVVAGRPNAGKSSLIKELIGVKIATGKRPGTTRKISKYSLGNGLVLVDLPGVGKMSGVSKHHEEKVNRQVIEFLKANAKNIVLAVAVLDISSFLEVTWRLGNKGFMSVDVEMVKFLAEELGEFPLVVANKIDKTRKVSLEENLGEFIYQISNGNSTKIQEYIFAVSTKQGKGIGKLKDVIHKKLVAKGYKTPFRKQT